MTREQEQQIDLIAADEGRVCVRPPYLDDTVEVTVPSGETWLISPGGNQTRRPCNHSVDWG